MAKIGEAKKAMLARKELADYYHKRIDKWLENANIADARDVEFMESLIRPWAEIEIMKGRKKSITLPCGVAKIIPGRDSVEVYDEPAALAWAKTFKPEAVKVTESILKSEIKGTDAPGYKIKQGYPKFSAKPNAELFGLPELSDE
jgi:hypothetical protein